MDMFARARAQDTFTSVAGGSRNASQSVRDTVVKTGQVSQHEPR